MNYGTRFRIVAVLFVVVLLVPAVLAQVSLIVPAKGGMVSVLDFETLNLKQTINAAGYQAFAAVGRNPRLVYVGSSNGSYLSVVDFTIAREVNRIYEVCPYAVPAFTPDRQYLLVEDQCDSSVKVLDTSTQKLVRTLNLAPYMGTGAQGTKFGSIVVVGQKAYVTTGAPDSSHPAIAVIDLNTFKIKTITIPAGYFEIYGLWSPNAAATPDGKYVVMVQTSPDYTTYHLLFISTATDHLVMDKTLDFDPVGLLITPVSSPGNVYGYLLGIDIDGQFSATLIDLNDGSPTLGQILTESEVVLQSYFNYNLTAVLNPEGTRLVVGGGRNGQSSPNPNLVVIDTTQMLHNPGGAIKGTAIVANGLNAHGMAIATITSTPPHTAPTVTSVTSSIVNDKDNLIKVTGTNFAPGAMMRVGTTPPLPANVDNSTTLHVMVPQNWPAQAKLDVVVTNPNMKMPPAQQYQSGLLAEPFTIFPTSDFQPHHQFAALVGGDFSVAVYEPNQQTMVDVPSMVLPYGITFNRYGKEIYSAGLGTRGLAKIEAAAWSPSDGTLQAETPFPAGSGIGSISEITLAASVNPFTGKPVVFVPLRTRSGSTYDVTVEMIDTDASSPTFNQVILTISAGLGLPPSEPPTAWGGTASPDGKYVYVSYYYSQSDRTLYFIGIFDVVHGTVTSLSTNSLRVAPVQTEMTVTPDGQSLLMTPISMNFLSSTAPIAVFDISTNPLNPVLVTTIYGTAPTQKGFYFISWKVVGNRLFALDGNLGSVVAFNFDRKNLNFSQLGVYTVGHPQNLGYYIGVSPDGALIYVPSAGYDMISVLDANKLVHGHPPLITNIGAFRDPFQVTVSPAAMYSGQ